jgi:hypothetical protein
MEMSLRHWYESYEKLEKEENQSMVRENLTSN